MALTIYPEKVVRFEREVETLACQGVTMLTVHVHAQQTKILNGD
jgi:hypothetical protein